MSLPSRVIYLPPGVVPGPMPAPQPGPAGPTGIPFDRQFFEAILPQAIGAFCKQIDCLDPVVELLTVDGTKHFVKGISGVSDAWVALHTVDEDHDHDIQAFIPFQTIFRVEVHPAEDAARRKLGFVLTSVREDETPPTDVPNALKK